MAKLEKQLHDVAHTSQPQPQPHPQPREFDTSVQKAASPRIPSTIPDPGARPDGANNSDRAKDEPSSGQSPRNREPSRNTKYAAVVSSGGGMRVSLEKQHALTQMKAWSGRNVRR